jgi:amino acid adenylation domain-containing protein
VNSAPEGIAIVGMAGRFPGANSIDELWANLLEGREGITRFTPDQLSPLVPPELARHPRYVPARGVMADADRFDAAFFGIPPREALLMDPQQRVFLELCWNALEDAGVDPERFPGSIGVYAGTSNNNYRKLVESRADLVQAAGDFATMLANEKDYVATRVAHRLNLTGPALSIHTACSTSLVAIAQAWYALMSWQCDLALAGGINIAVPQESGYLPVEGAMESEDGHCRPFDAAANGTLFSSGGAVVVLKRVAEAVADGDTIYAVIRGVGVNNDGSDKASFSAPSVRGQAAVIRQALGSAGVDAASIGYVEAHGTATSLGDPIEITALTRAFRQDTPINQACWIGSVKGNLGHLIAASGVTGLIKAALALHHGKIPATLHYRAPNPEIDFAASPFKVADRMIDWPRGDQPRRAGVSSFGVGGTNAHVILEEAPSPAISASGRRVSLLLLSARDEPALQRRAADLAVALAGHSAGDLPDIGYTLALGRKPLPKRTFVVAGDIADARTRLANISARTAETTPPPLVFLFPGQGSQHADMARSLVNGEPVFRDAFERCCALASAHLGRDLRALILPAAGAEKDADAALAETRYTQPALFSVEYALAELWESWGLVPAAMIGHSIGEYVAACRAGVFSLEDAVALVVARGAAMFAQPSGAMLAVRVGADELATRLPQGIEIAGRNTPGLTVVSGAVAAIDGFAEMLAKDDIASTRLRVSHAFHSASMDAALPVFRRAFDKVQMQAPHRVFYSCLSGAPITPDQALSVDYWCRQLREPVRFADAVQHVLATGRTLFLEVGPSQALTGLARAMLDGQGRAVASLGAAAQPGDAVEQVQRALGECWCAGAQPDWQAFYAGQTRRRVALPGYPFRGERYWVEPATASASTMSHIAQEQAIMYEGRESSATPAPVVVTPRSRAPRLAAELRELFENLSGERITPEHDADSFLSLGLDSLALTQATLEIERRYGVKLKFRRLMEDLDSVARLVVLLDETLPAEAIPAVVAAPATMTSATIPATSAAMSEAGESSALTQLIQSQMALMAQQAELLRALAGPALAPVAASSPASPVAAPAAAAAGDDAAPADLKERPFGASARIVSRRLVELTPAQRDWVDDFSHAYGARTAKSKAFSQQHRALMADPRVVTGFNPLWKELTYPIVVERSSGARLWDLDGHEYIDLLNGFGVNFLGYQPDYIKTALHEQIDAGIEIGPQHPLTAEVAQLISDMTGMQRVAFCNTGSEAVMGAMRIARTVTGRKTIVIFKDSYHGIFDEVIVRGTRTLRSIAAAPGILANAVENVLVLDYGSDEALRIIRERAHELAAVMIEPVQSRNPTLQPSAFVKELRTLCDAGGCALIFDEVITGFRMAPGGAQEYYGVRADIATYGKIIGGGLPFAAIAGSTHWMDALDGGHWQFGDESYPEAGVTYFAGTFVRHPLALAAAHAALTYVKQQGPALQAELNARTAGLIEQLNALFKVRRAPMSAVGYSSLWRIKVDEDQPCAGLFWYRLRYEGLHVYEQFNCFLSVAHGEAEVARIVASVAAAVDVLMGAGVLTSRDGVESAAVAALEAAPTKVSDAAASFTDDADLPGTVPLSEAQLEKWLGTQYSDAAAASFNESTSLEFRGALDLDALQRAVDTVVQRHDVLAMRFTEDGSGQAWEPPCQVHLQILDLSGRSDPDAAYASFAAQEASHAFDLANPPFMRIHLLKLAADRHALLVTAHHMVMDGWAWGVLSGEIALCYNAFRAGTEPVLPAVDSWRRFVLDEHARRDGAEGAASLTWWLQHYQSIPDPLSLPTDHPRSHALTFSGATTALRLDAALTTELREAARARRVTLFGLLLSGFYILMHRLTGQDDLVCGIPFAGQAVSKYQQTMGDSDNTLPLRVSVSATDAFASVLKRVQGSLLDAGDHQDISLGRIVNALKLPRNTGRLMLVDVIFNLNPVSAEIAYDGLEHHQRDLPKTHLNWDMAFHFNERDGALDLLLHYNSDLFDASTTERWAGYLREILRQAAASPDTPVGDFELMDALERGKVLRDWNATASDYNRAQGLPALIEAQMRRTPQQIAAECQGERLDYAGLEHDTHALAQALARRGIGRGDMVGVCMPRSLDMLVAVVGVLRSGAAYVPLDPEFPVERLHYMAEHARLRHILVSQTDLIDATLASGRELLTVGAMVVEPTNTSPLPEVRGDDLAYVLFTSGSTGKPKGVRILHRNLVNFLLSMRAEPGFGANDVLCAVTTLSFDIAGLELYLPLIAGGRVVIATEFENHDPQALCELIERSGCNVLQTTPSLLKLLQDMGREEVIRGLRLFVGGEALPLVLARTMSGSCREFWNLYGPTETTIWSTVVRVRPDMDVIPLGRPIANTSIYVLDGRGRPVPPGVMGEIFIGGDGVADGYLFQPELSAERFVADPFAGGTARMYRTGDLGSWRDGELYFHGRADFQIKIRGYRIEPGDIEAAASTDQAVRECVVVAHHFGDNDLRLVLYAAVAGDDPTLSARLRDRLRERLPGYMQPQHIELLGALPKTPNGKIDRKALPLPAASTLAARAVAARTISPQVTGSTSPAAITDPRRAYLAAIWCELIGVQDVRDSDNFFDIGGHSLLAVEFAIRVQRETGVRLNLFGVATSTLASLALDLPEPEHASQTKPATLGTRLRRMLGLGGER